MSPAGREAPAPASLVQDMAEPLVLHGARLGSSGPRADIRLVEGIIAGVGNLDRQPGDQVLDVGGATILPGLWDAHVHATQWALARRRVDVSQATSAADAVSAIADAPAVARDGAAFVTAFGFRDWLWRDQPHKDQLGRALPDVPLVVISNDMHTVWLSPAALAALGLSDHPTGVLREDEAFRAQQRIPSPPSEEIDRSLNDLLDRAAARGVTGLMDFEYADNLADWTRRHAARALPLRVTCTIYPDHLDAVIERGLRTGDDFPGSDGMIQVGPLKVFMDGSLNTRTALCEDPYSGAADLEHPRGLLLTEPDELEELMRRAHRHGLQTAVHAIGDRANRLALDVFERVGCGGRIEHAQLLNPEDLARFGKLGIAAGIQPVHALADRDVADRVWAGRTSRAFCYRPLLEAGATVEIGSDAPVASPDPWRGIAAAVARTSEGRPAWHPENSLTLDQALIAASRGRRTLTVGDTADLVIVAADPAEVAVDELGDMPVLGTMVGGRWTFRTQTLEGLA